MQIDGACLCGKVSYTAVIDPGKVTICHCTDCQVSSASAYRLGAPVRKDNFALTSGELKFFIKTAESGSKRALGFCPECGTSIYGCDPVEPRTYSLRLGTSRQRHQLKPALQIWGRSSVKWANDLNDIAAHQTQPWRPKRAEPEAVS